VETASKSNDPSLKSGLSVAATSRGRKAKRRLRGTHASLSVRVLPLVLCVAAHIHVLNRRVDNGCVKQDISVAGEYRRADATDARRWVVA
jgi:hypothetical protein